jgi:endonuclease YncB( thermonuclease family)
MRRIALLIVALVLAGSVGSPWPAGGADAPQPAPAAAIPAAFAVLNPGESARVGAVIDGDTVVLKGGDEVRLVGIQAPKLPLGRPSVTKWPLADAAKAALEALVRGREVTLAFGERRSDRHGRLLAHLAVDGVWVQGEMLRQGLARVYTFADNRRLAAEMLALEGEAREARRGIWADKFYRVLAPVDLDTEELGTFQLVQGRVRKAAAVGRYVYLNFGDDYRTDFTAVIMPEARKLFGAGGPDAAFYQGRLVRVRGWIDSFNGPMIEVTHPEQIEALE